MAAAIDNTLKDGSAEKSEDAQKEVKVVAVPGKQPTPHKKISHQSSDKPAIFMTGATHARELISTTLNYFEILQLI